MSHALRYVLFWHTPPDRSPHFDLMLETHPRRKLLKFETPSLRLPLKTPLKLSFTGTVRRRYLAFEGDIGKGRGSVKRVAQGTYSLTQHKNYASLTIVGGILGGSYSLRQKASNQYTLSPRKQASLS
jgi:hypothetical protein